MDNIQKEKWFTELGPNGRIPVLVDHDVQGEDGKPLSIMEGQAILSYLTRHYDPDHKFSFTQDPELSICEQWIAWQHGGLGPMQGQANHFYRLAKERIPYPTQRYVGEAERLYGVLDSRLATRDYLVGNKFSIADIANFGWVNGAYFSGIKLDDFPNVYRWWQRINERPAVQKGTSVPDPPRVTNQVFRQKLKDDPEFAAKEKELAEIGQKAKEQYDYKYASP
ncbi:putative disulfide bond reductase yfcG [Polychaeton citri CBS 116435]|uniref:Disulfide bond reductase yfcG n=1 Tax=Polychaeton citri CBS 116435 TaxID=1314669 RepID=A0A9P4QFM6_9PEZI|nr:putative disulfide bond reductase yfcG [Polychaeton citri CBS 116435]